MRWPTLWTQAGRSCLLSQCDEDEAAQRRWSVRTSTSGDAATDILSHARAIEWRPPRPNSAGPSSLAVINTLATALLDYSLCKRPAALPGFLRMLLQPSPARLHAQLNAAQH